MKALLATADSIFVSPYPRVRLLADSAIAPDREPLWLDLDGPEKVALTARAWRIGRLGRNIKPQFAHRYVDAVCDCALIVPREWAERPLDAPDIVLASTEALIAGPDRPLEPHPTDQGWQLPPDSFAAETLCRLSEYMIFKNGDRLIDLSAPDILELKPGRDLHLPGLNIKVR